MGLFVNPDNSAFQMTLNSPIYVDKTKLIEYTNSVLNTDNAFICSSRPRRFGKSITANMLTSYYSKGCKSEEMFFPLEISKSTDFRRHLNQYDVIRFDVQWCMMDAGSPEATVKYINEHLITELKEAYPEIPLENAKTAYGVMSRINSANGNKFVVIIDEWDVLIRDEAANEKVQKEYIDFLRGMFKGIIPTSFIALAYITGILPIKKIQTESALNNFDEFTMIDSGCLAPYIGFTEEEVKELCAKYQVDFGKVKCWYDGYFLEDYQVYNPKAVVNVLLKGKFRSYWSETASYGAIVPLINMNYDGLKTAVIEMLSGSVVKVNTKTFKNDTINIQNRDDVLTYLIHLGYLAYDQDRETAFVPNEEIR
ncbi:MAG: AAA family ATPase, partial [Blautia sp.]|nr:AAA family ATPase [Blautia sp.]